MGRRDEDEPWLGVRVAGEERIGTLAVTPAITSSMSAEASGGTTSSWSAVSRRAVPSDQLRDDDVDGAPVPPDLRGAGRG